MKNNKYFRILGVGVYFAWQWLRRPDWLLRTLMVGALLIFGWRCWFLYQEAQLLYLQVTLQSSIAGQVQLYYDRGYSFNEHDSVVVHIAKDRRKLWGVFPWPENWSDSSYQHYRFQLPPSTIYALRFDPFLTSGTMRIKSIEVVDGLGHHLQTIDLNQLKPVKQIKAFNISNQEVTLTAEEEGGPQLNILLDSPLMLDRSRSFLRAGFIGRILIDLIVIILVAAFLLMLKGLAPSATFVKFAVTQLSYLRNPLIQDRFIFVLLTALFLWAYYPLNTIWFPIIFEKSLFCVLVILTARYFWTRDTWERKMNPLFCGMFFYILWLLISAGIHYFALNSVGSENYISANINGTNWSPTTLFDKYQGILLLNNETSIYMYFFPFLFLVSIALFRSTYHGWKKLTWIPLIFTPCLLVALYQVYVDSSFLNNRPFDDFMGGLTSSFRAFRILMFLIFPLCVFAGVIAKKWCKKGVFFFLAVVILWLTKLGYGRAAILGILIFIFMLPMIRLWVHGFRNITVRKYLYVGLVWIFGFTILAGVAFPKYHRFISFLLDHRFVTSFNALLSGDFTHGHFVDRVDASRQAWRLIRLSPVSGWGPGGYLKNANRIRHVNGEKIVYQPTIPNLYLQMGANLGIVGGGVMLFLHVMPLWMIIRVRKRIQNHEERWAVGIIFATVSIMLLFFITDSNINYPEVNWIYTLYLGFLVSVALKYGYTFYPIKSWLWGIGGLFLTIVFIVGTYSTTFGSHGYQAIQKELISLITRGYYTGAQMTIWDSKKMTGTIKVSNILIKTRGNPNRMKYTTNEFRMQATSNLYRMQATSNLFCVRTSVSKRSNQGSFILVVRVFLNDRAMDKHYIYSSGEKMLYYYVPNIANNEVEIKIEVDLRKSIPYHEDYRIELDQRYMPYHEDYSDLGVTVSVIPFIKAFPQNGIDFSKLAPS